MAAILSMFIIPYAMPRLLYCVLVFPSVEVFLPSPDTLLVNLHESKEMITDFLTKLPSFFEKNMETGSALGPALQAAYKLMVGVVH